jgi:hypothetical protein
VRSNHSVTFTNLTLALLLFAPFAWWVGNSYFSVNSEASISFSGDDGWCNFETEGVGVHCFGDYQYPKLLAGIESPWQTDYVNPHNGLGLLFFRFFSLFERIFELFFGADPSSRITLVMYSLLSIAVASIPAIWSSWTKNFETKLKHLLIIGPISSPALMAIDRGNAIVFCAPLILWFLISVKRDQKRFGVIAVVVLAAIKPQFFVLIILLLIFKWWRHAVWCFIFVGITQFGAYLFWPTAFPESIFYSVRGLKEFANYQSVSANYPSNIGFARGIYSVVHELEIDAFVSATFNFQSETIGYAIQTLTGPLIFTVGLICLVRLKDKISNILTAIMFIPLIFLFSGTTFGYYAVFAIPIGALVLRDPNSSVVSRKDHWLDSESEYFRVFLSISLALTLFWLPLPMIIGELQTGENLVFTTSAGIPFYWLLTFLIFALRIARHQPELEVIN